MNADRDRGAAAHTVEWCTAGWDGVIALTGLAVLMLGLPLAIVVVLGCWVALALRRSGRGRPGRERLEH
jgi:hypothetical protein